MKLHCEGISHKSKASQMKADTLTLRIMDMFMKKKQDNEELKTVRAEALWTNFLVEHSLPTSTSDHASKLFKRMFPDLRLHQASHVLAPRPELLPKRWPRMMFAPRHSA